MNRTVFSLALSTLFQRRRAILIAAAPALLLVMALLINLLGQDRRGQGLITAFALPIILPLVALICATSVISSEVEDGSIVYLLAAPVPRHAVAVSKFLAAALATTVFGAVPLFVASYLLDTTRPVRAFGWLVAALVAGTVYTALFLVFGAWVRHAVVLGLVFTVLWEGLLGGLLSGVRWLTIKAWGQQIGSAISSAVPDPGLNLSYAIVAAALLLAAGLWITGDRLRSYSMTGSTV